MTDTNPVAVSPTNAPATSGTQAQATPTRAKRKAKKRGPSKARKAAPQTRSTMRPSFFDRQLDTLAKTLIAPYLNSMDQSKVHGFGSLHAQFVNQFGTIPFDLFKRACTVLGVSFTSGTRIQMANDPRKELAYARAQTYAEAPRSLSPGVGAPTGFTQGSIQGGGGATQVSPRLASMVSQRAAMDAGLDAVGLPVADTYNGPNTAGVGVGGNDIGFDNERR